MSTHNMFLWRSNIINIILLGKKTLFGAMTMFEEEY